MGRNQRLVGTVRGEVQKTDIGDSCAIDSLGLHLMVVLDALAPVFGNSV